MKKILFNLALFAGAFMAHSCEIDNYEAPGATMQGMILDAGGEGLQLEQGAGSTRIRMEELSWSDSPIPFYLNFKQDGSYINNKLFAGTYLAAPINGPYYPVSSDTVTLQGTTSHDFHVVPYLDVEWVKEPWVLPGGEVSATFRFSRNDPPAGEAKPDLLDYQLFISTTQYVGNNNFDGTIVASAVKATNDLESQELTITSSAPMKYATTYFIRVGVRVNDNFKKYNYTTIKTVTAD